MNGAAHSIYKASQPAGPREVRIRPPAPRITSLGAPPERHAARVVDEMLRWMHEERRVLNDKAAGMINVRRMGGPRAQTRTARRLAEALRWACLGIELQPAKNGKFELSLTTWRVWDPALGQPLSADDPLPVHPWLCCVTSLFTGQNNTGKAEHWPFVALSHHSLVRMAQRANARSPKDLVILMRELWNGVFALLAELQHNKGPHAWLSPPTGAWRIRLPDGCLVILEPARDDHKHLVVKTVLSPGMGEGSFEPDVDIQP